jgi:hypothetical protein
MWWHFFGHSQFRYPSKIFIFNFFYAGALAHQLRTTTGSYGQKSLDKLPTTTTPNNVGRNSSVNGLGKVFDIHV